MTNERPNPPAFHQRLFEWFCKGDIFDELQGDLEEEFHMIRRQDGLKKANRFYKREVMKMVRPSVVKKLKSNYQLNTTAMFRNYTIIAFRSLAKNRLFSAINIIGLAISMAVGLIAIAFVSEVYQYDNFHKNRDRLYRVVSDLHRPDGPVSKYATASVYTGLRLANDFAGFEAVAPIARNLYGTIAKGESKIDVMGIHTNAGFFEVLSFELLAGDPATALSEPNSLILTETTAKKLFNKLDVVGEVVQYNEETPMKVTGLLKDPPAQSHLKFDVIGSLKTLEAAGSSTFTSYSTIWSSFVYVLLPENHDLELVQRNLDQLAKEENPKLTNWTLSMGLESMDDIFPGDGRYNQYSVVMPREKVTSVIVLALIVLFSACFNYTNLSMARSLKRAKEIGVRKVVGASKGHLFFQFIMEAILVSLIAVVISYLLFGLLKGQFMSLDLYIERTMTLELAPVVYLYFLLFAITVGFFSGLFPSLLITRFKPVNILKGVSAIKTSQGIGVRKVLVAIQFVLSMGFATLVVMAFKQYKYAVNFDLGFQTENVLNVDIQGNDPEVLKAQFAGVPGVTGISSSSMVPSTGSSQSNYIRYKDRPDSVSAYTFDVDANYLANMGHELIAGTGFESGEAGNKVIINELLVKNLGIENAAEIIGQTIRYYDQSWVVTGVIKNFHHGTINDELSPFAFTMGRQQHYHINLKLSPTNIVETMARLEEAWQEVDDVSSFQALFFDEWIERTYQEVSASIKIFGFLASIAICISILGLLGMAVYTAESRIKELAIRKVLGATLSNLLILLSQNFMAIFVISAALAIPLAYYIYLETIVSDAVYKISIGFWELGSGALIIIFIALLTITSQTLRAARSNPAENLRNE